MWAKQQGEEKQRKPGARTAALSPLPGHSANLEKWRPSCASNQTFGIKEIRWRMTNVWWLPWKRKKRKNEQRNVNSETLSKWKNLQENRSDDKRQTAPLQFDVCVCVLRPMFKSILTGLQVMTSLPTFQPHLFWLIHSYTWKQEANEATERCSQESCSKCSQSLKDQGCGLLSGVDKRFLKHFHFAMVTALMWHPVKGLEILAQDLWSVDTPFREHNVYCLIQKLIPLWTPPASACSPLGAHWNLVPRGASSFLLLGSPGVSALKAGLTSHVDNVGFRRRALKFSGKLYRKEEKKPKAPLGQREWKYFASCFHKLIHRAASRGDQKWLFVVLKSSKRSGKLGQSLKRHTFHTVCTGILLFISQKISSGMK